MQKRPNKSNNMIYEKQYYFLECHITKITILEITKQGASEVYKTQVYIFHLAYTNRNNSCFVALY